MRYDVIVIGTGLSGLMAAKAALDRGARTLVIGKGTGSLVLFSNTVDILGTMPEARTIEDGLSEWIKDHPSHPYALVGLSNILEAVSSFSSLFTSTYSLRPIGNRNCHTITPAGTFRPTYMIPSTMMDAHSLADGKTLIIGFQGFKDFQASCVAKGLGARGENVPLLETHLDLNSTSVARLMENPSACERLGELVLSRIQNEVRIGFPAVMGLHDPMEVKKNLERKIGLSVFEIPTLPPSIPGKRIYDRLKKWLTERGATFLIGNTVSHALVKGKRCEGVFVYNPPVSKLFRADRYILCTGRFTGGGLAANFEKIVEPVFNLPVSQPASRSEWYGKSFFHSHPIHRAGILVDLSLRPIDSNGKRLIDNLWIAGSILANHETIREKSREGIEIATGYTAAKNALEN